MGLIVLGLALGVLWVAGLVGGVAAWMGGGPREECPVQVVGAVSFVGKTKATSMTEGVETRPTLSPR